MITAMTSPGSSPAALDQLRVAVDAALGVILSADEAQTALEQAWPYLQHAAALLDAEPAALDSSVIAVVREATHAARIKNFDQTRTALVTARGRLVRPTYHGAAPQ